MLPDLNIVEVFTVVEAEPVPSMPETAQRISDQMYVLDTLGVLFEHFSLTFPEGAAKATFAFRRWEQDFTFSVGLDNMWRVNVGMGPDAPIYRALRGSWSNENTFVIEEALLDQEKTGRLVLTFEGDQAAFTYQYQDAAGNNSVVETRGRLQE